MEVMIDLSDEQVATIRAAQGDPLAFVRQAVDVALDGGPQERFKQLVIDAITGQRNRALDELAQAQSVIEMLQAQLAQQPGKPQAQPDAPAGTPPGDEPVLFRGRKKA
jgi:hypothetical protein